MPCWSTERPGSPTSIGHRMQEDAHGRPTSPLCGRSTEGLWFRQHDWSQVPQRQRCTECEQRVRLIRGDRPATWRRFKDDFVMLESGRVEIDDESRDYLVAVDVETGPKGAHCRRIAVRARPNKGDIGTQVLREVQVPPLMELAASAFVGTLYEPDRGLDGGFELPAVHTDDDGSTLLTIGSGSTEEAAAWLNGFITAQQQSRPARARRISDEDLRQFADLVKMRGGLPYMKTVMEVMRLTPDQARKWKPKAIKAGYVEEDA